MHTELKFQEELAKKYKYQPLPLDLSNEVRSRHFEALKTSTIKDCWYGVREYKTPLYTQRGTLIANNFNRVVIGDYGAFIEIDPIDMAGYNLKVKEGQEFRYYEQYKTCKYYWLTAKDDSNIKIYHQKGTVKYADYKKGKYYVSPYEVSLEGYDGNAVLDWIQVE